MTWESGAQIEFQKGAKRKTKKLLSSCELANLPQKHLSERSRKTLKNSWKKYFEKGTTSLEKNQNFIGTKSLSCIEVGKVVPLFNGDKGFVSS